MRFIHDTETQTITLIDGDEVAEVPIREWYRFMRALEWDDVYQGERMGNQDVLVISSYFRQQREKRKFEEERERGRQREPAAD